MTTQELLKTAQFTLTNRALAARLRVLRYHFKDQLSELDRNDLQLAAERLEMLDSPTVNEINAYFRRQELNFESPIDNEL